MTDAPPSTLYVIDASSIMHRLYHAVPIETTRARDSDQPLNVVIGWVRSLRRLREFGARYIVPVFDGEGPGWRHEAFPAYKSERRQTDEDLRGQFPLVVPDDAETEIELLREDRDANLILDGRLEKNIKPHQKITVQKSKNMARFVRFSKDFEHKQVNAGRLK
jgi:5'-3' exonuclease